MWLASFSLLLPLYVKCPNWSGFKQHWCSSVYKPGPNQTRYNILCTDVCTRSNENVWTISQHPRWIICRWDCGSFNRTRWLIVRLGGFHLLMGSLGVIMNNSGIESLVNCLCAELCTTHVFLSFICTFIESTFSNCCHSHIELNSWGKLSLISPA